MGSYVKDSDESSPFWAYQKGWRNEWIRRIRPQAIFRPKELETQLWNLGGISSFKFFLIFTPIFPREMIQFETCLKQMGGSTT